MDAFLSKQHPDLIILDLMLPGEDGLSLARRLRVSGNIPIIMLTARGEEVDRIIGLERGRMTTSPSPSARVNSWPGFGRTFAEVQWPVHTQGVIRIMAVIVSN